MDSDAKRSEVRHRQMRKSFSAINDQLGIMVKAHAAARQLAAQQREAQREAGRQGSPTSSLRPTRPRPPASSGRGSGEARRFDRQVRRSDPHQSASCC